MLAVCEHWAILPPVMLKLVSPDGTDIAAFRGDEMSMHVVLACQK